MGKRDEVLVFDAVGWLTHPAVRTSPLRERAMLLDLLLFAMHDEPGNKITNTSAGFARMCGLSTREFDDTMISLERVGLLTSIVDENDALTLLFPRQFFAVPIASWAGRLDVSLCEWREIRQQVIERDGTECHYCGIACSHDLTIDHVHPISKGGTSAIDNLVVACRSCNSSKGARTNGEA